MKSDQEHKKSLKILVVDDDELLRSVLTSEFCCYDHIVTEASDGAEALEQLKREKFDLVVSDVRMPNMDGVELLSHIRELDVETPVFMFITGFADLSLDDAYNMGANALFPKPFDREVFFNAVDRATLPKAERWQQDGALETDFDVEIRVNEDDNLVKGKVLSIGQGGMFLAVEEPSYKTGSKIRFTIQFGMGTPAYLTGVGEVRWVNPSSTKERAAGYGIEFLSFDDQFIPEAIHLIEALRPKPYIPNT